MGVAAAAIIGGAAVAGAGIQAYGASQAGSSAANASRQAGEQFRKSGEQAQQRLAPYEKLLKNPSEVLRATIQANRDNVKGAQRITNQINYFNQSQLQQAMNRNLPGYQGIINRALRNTRDWVRGEIPKDVQSLVRNAAATKANAFGLAPTSEAARAISARDLGTTSLNLMQQGQNSLQSWIQTAKTYLTPAQTSVSDFFMNPAQYTNQIIAAANIAGQRGQIQMGAQNMATNQYLAGEAAAASADQQMYAAISEGLQSAATAYGGSAGGGGGYTFAGAGRTGPNGATRTGTFNGTPVYQGSLYQQPTTGGRISI